MRIQFKSIIIFAMLATFLTGCATFPQKNEPTQKSNLSVGMAKKEIIKGKTNQAEIMQLFGAPNLITKNRNNDEVWNYNKMSYQSMSGKDAGSLIFWGGSRAMSSSTTQSFDLIITFDENDVVKDYSIISAAY